MRKTFRGLAVVIAMSMFAQPVFAITVSDIPAALTKQNKVHKSEISSTPASFSKQALKSNTQKDLAVSTLTAQTSDKVHPAYVEGEIIVKFRENRVDLKKAAGVSRSTQFATRQNLSFKENIRRANLTVLKTKGKETTDQAIARLKNDPDVEYVQPNYQYYRLAEGGGGSINDASYGEQWALENIGQTVNGAAGTNDADIDANESWDITDGEDVIVAIIDSGVAYNHPDLLQNMWDGDECVDENGSVLDECNHGYDFEDDDKTPLPTSSSHGTHIAGIIAARKNNSVGIVGVAPSAKIMALKSSLTTAQNVAAINFAKQNGAKAINASWACWGDGGTDPATACATFEELDYRDQALTDAIAGFPGLFIAAAGNGGGDADLDGDNHDSGQTLHAYPCDLTLPNIICVAATDQDDVMAFFSDFGTVSIDLGAPGVNILSTIADSTVMTENFNSVTTPSLPSGWEKTGDWGTHDFSGNKVLYSDLAVPYANNANSVATSPSIDLAGAASAMVSFVTQCDTQYSPTEWTDYMQLKYSGDGVNFVPVPVVLGESRWDESLLDLLNGDSDPSGGALFIFSEVQLPGPFSASSKLQFGWITNGSDNDYDACFIDDLVVTKISDGSDGLYDYKSGTSMATPHVAGVAAQVYALRPDFTTAQVKDVILASGDANASLVGKTVMGKRLNAFAALDTSNNSTLIVKKVVVNDDGGTAATSTFAFKVNHGDSQSFEEDGQNELTLDAGTYTVTEVEATGYTPTYLDCTDIVLASGETKTCTITNDDVEVPDTTPPVINLTGETTIDLIVGAEFSDPGFEAIDDVDGDISANVAKGGDTVDTATPGTYVITYNVSDSAGNAAEEKIRTVNVSDVEAPTFSGVPENQNVEATSAAGAVVTYTFPTATDDVDESVTVTCAPESGTTFAMGTTVVECSASDSAGNDASMSFNVVVADTTDPEISNMPENQTIEITEGDSSTASYSSPTATDNIDGSVSVSCSPESGATFALGATSVRCSATDSAGNETIASFTIEVVLVDETSPVITLNGESTITLELGDLFTDPGATATDNVNGNLTDEIVVGGDTVDTNTPGTYTITYNVSDAAGNVAAEQTRTVTVLPAPPSDLTTLTATIDEAQTLHDGATEGDAPGQYPTGSRATLQAAIDEASLITTAGSQSEVDTAVVVLETAITTFEESVIGLSDLTALAALIEEAEAIADDAVVGEDPGEYSQASLDTFNTAIAEAQAVDNTVAQSTVDAAVASLNDAVDTFEASVVPTPDATAPIITLLGSATTSVALGNIFADPGATANDDVDGAVTPVVSGSVDTNAVGTYALTYTATDAAGNTSSVVRNVIVSATSLEIDTTSSGDTQTGTLSNAATIATTTPSGNVTIAMPANLTVSGPAGWDGTIDLPTSVTTTVVPVADSGSTATSVSSIEIGFGTTTLTFDKGVRIHFAGRAGNLIGYSHGADTFTAITSTCSGDSQTVGDALAAGSDCKISVGSDLIVWTKHFSTFTTYTQTAIPTPTPSPAPSSGGGGGGGGGEGGISYTYSVTINNGAVEATSTAVSLAVAPANANQMQISNTSEFASSTWLPFQNTYPWALAPGAGVKTVYVRYGNNGSVIANAQDSITLVGGAVLGAQTQTQQSVPQGLIGVGGGQVLGASVYNFTKMLQRGSRGRDVEELQKILIAAGYLDIEAPTAFFGVMTEAAVKAYQEANGLEQVGVVGPKTRALLNKGTSSKMPFAAPSAITDEQRDLLIVELMAKVRELTAKLEALKAQQLQ
ncbi:MAG: hypothetical protein UY63_C0001G0037 [Parcubacteria group bacterium GW2011_GWA2_51_10]|nr:MAG: hypothetical protein UY63_C0001G0037 [Parcubacteria group bacterium GW2011_GWA2_51_10]